MRFLLLFLFALSSFQAFTQIELPSIIGSNMVLPKETKVRLWGWGRPSEKIRVKPSWSNRTDSVVVSRDGKWEQWVETPGPGGPHSISFSGSSTVVVDNILTGAVWLCSGQSNMEWNYYNKVDDMEPELARHTQPQIRFFQVDRRTAEYPQEDVRGRWVVCDSNTLKSFSAVGYFFGRRLHDSTGMPVGLINASWGGTPAEVWMPAQTVAQNDTWRQEAERHNKTPWWTVTPGFAYNAMIHPLTPFVIDGAIWYQGESNVGAAGSYSGLLTAMIGSWRKTWNKELPFYLVQIAPYKYGNSLNAAILREQQQQVTALVPRTGMVVVSDLVKDTTDIHPTNKKDVGFRLAALALHDVYGKGSSTARSKVYAAMEKKGNKVVVAFSGNDYRLMMKGRSPVALEVAGANKVFLPAQAKIVGNRLEVWHPQIKDPVAVRYQFHPSSIGNLADEQGFPVAPFRTDSW